MIGCHRSGAQVAASERLGISNKHKSNISTHAERRWQLLRKEKERGYHFMWLSISIFPFIPFALLFYSFYISIYMYMLFFVAKLFKCFEFCGKTTNYRIVFDSEGRFPSKRCLQSGRASQTFVLYRTIVCETAAHTS